jgi:hypothetical protein
METPIEALDSRIGEMIEGLYAWNEYCPDHAVSYMAVYPDRHHRSVSVYEVTNSWREYRCYACNRLLWSAVRPVLPPAPHRIPVESLDEKKEIAL